MSTSKRWASPVLVAVLAVACSDTGPTGPNMPSGPIAQLPDHASVAGQSARSPIDVSGDWEWRREEKLTVPDQWAFIFGVQPEGPITHLDCELEGVITLVQVGSDLSGTEMETWSRCETRGGQVSTQPGLGVLIPIPEGRVAGRTVKLRVGDAEVICPIRATIVDADEGVAQTLRGTGRCWVPGHPRSNPPEGSPLDLDPPPAGTEKIVVWEAFRPAV